MYKKTTVMQSLIEGNLICERKPWIIYPEDKWKYVFDFCIALLTLYYCILVPYRIGFEPEVSKTWKWLEYFFDVFFFIDIGLRFRCAYVEDI